MITLNLYYLSWGRFTSVNTLSPAIFFSSSSLPGFANLSHFQTYFVTFCDVRSVTARWKGWPHDEASSPATPVGLPLILMYEAPRGRRVLTGLFCQRDAYNSYRMGLDCHDCILTYTCRLSPARQSIKPENIPGTIFLESNLLPYQATY